jgi:hypothetical protein
MKITTQTEEITPAMAEKYLEKNFKNRSVKPKTVRTYANDMLAGNWHFTHQGIAFDENDHLIDGQHRLLAIVESGVTVKMLVTRGLPAEAGKGENITKKTMDAIDQGVMRSVADQLRLTYDATGRVNLLVACTARIVRLVFGDNRAVSKLSTPQCVEMQFWYGEHIEKVIDLAEGAPLKEMFRAPLLGGIAFCRAAYPAETDRFLDLFIHGNGAPKSGPRVLFERIESGNASVGYTPKDRLRETGIALAAVRAFIEDRKLASLEYKPGDFQFFSVKQPEKLAGMGKIFFPPVKKKDQEWPLEKPVIVPQPIQAPAKPAPKSRVTAKKPEPAFVNYDAAPAAEKRVVSFPENVSESQALDEWMDAAGSLRFSSEEVQALEARYLRIKSRSNAAA